MFLAYLNAGVCLVCGSWVYVLFNQLAGQAGTVVRTGALRPFISHCGRTGGT